MDRVFLDANVLFSAAYRPAGGLQRLWSLSRAGKVKLVTSAYAVEEAGRNLASPPQIRNLEKLLGDVEVTVSSAPEDPAVQSSGLPDKDRPILQAAISSEATHLITGDNTHFSHLYGKTIRGVLVLTPAQYLRG